MWSLPVFNLQRQSYTCPITLGPRSYCQFGIELDFTNQRYGAMATKALLVSSTPEVLPSCWHYKSPWYAVYSNTTAQQLDYWGRLKKLSRMSLRRQRERYILLHMWKILHGSISNDLNINFTSRPQTGIKAVGPPYEGVLLLATRASMTIHTLLLAHVSGTSLWSRDIHPLIPTPSWNGERIV